jgi:hypothetical protein
VKEEPGAGSSLRQSEPPTHRCRRSLTGVSMTLLMARRQIYLILDPHNVVIATIMTISVDQTLS